MEDESNVWDAAPCRTEPQSARKIWPWAPASAPVGPGCAYAESRRATMLTRLSSSNRGAVVRLPARLGSEPLATNKQLAGPLPGDTKTHERRVHARMLTPADWASASRYLGLPERFKHNALHATLARFTGHGSLTKLLNDQAHRERPRSVGWAPRRRAAPSAPGNLARHRREHLALPSTQPTNRLPPPRLPRPARQRLSLALVRAHQRPRARSTNQAPRYPLQAPRIQGTPPQRATRATTRYGPNTPRYPNCRTKHHPNTTRGRDHWKLDVTLEVSLGGNTLDAPIEIRNGRRGILQRCLYVAALLDGILQLAIRLGHPFDFNLGKKASQRALLIYVPRDDPPAHAFESA